MKEKSIGSRLLTAAALVSSGKTVCDVGCDHGKLSLYLIQSGKAEKIIATDINKMPLQKAIDLFAGNNLSHKAQFYLTDGLQNIADTDDITHVVICGLGGDTMAQIIENAPFIKQNKVKLVLIPAQSGNKIRQYLYDSGFEITGETTVGENKKFYSAICAEYNGEKADYTDFDCFIGKSRFCTDESAKGYFEMVLTQLKKRQKGFVIDTGVCPDGIAEAVEKTEQLLKNFE
ncbi:MAG: SAM-dependent methyltransferase [Oscillospiraceae bacterium]|nr:SAM-dependent methyltransferase [Oscillospiraceae bacterium]MBQ7815892.1 SAM-dependent methyltransferase [Oscillospiraceae bacterium]